MQTNTKSIIEYTLLFSVGDSHRKVVVIRKSSNPITSYDELMKLAIKKLKYLYKDAADNTNNVELQKQYIEISKQIKASDFKPLCFRTCLLANNLSNQLKVIRISDTNEL